MGQTLSLWVELSTFAAGWLSKAILKVLLRSVTSGKNEKCLTKRTLTGYTKLKGWVFVKTLQHNNSLESLGKEVVLLFVY